MPLLQYITEKFPEWSEIEKVEHLNLTDQAEYQRKVNSKAALFVIQGYLTCFISGSEEDLYTNDSLIITTSDMKIKVKSATAEILIIYGNWEYQIGNSGFFTLKNCSIPQNIGDKVEYQRSTDFDNHFHDCDEYWFILKGSGIAFSEGIQYNFQEGGCIATRAGEHHDIPLVNEEVSGIYFETTLKGLKRKGHLWRHTHPINISKASNEV